MDSCLFTVHTLDGQQPIQVQEGNGDSGLASGGMHHREQFASWVQVLGADHCCLKLSNGSELSLQRGRATHCLEHPSAENICPDEDIKQ